MRFGKIVKMFKNGNVCVTGLRGTGKDLLCGNVIARRKKPYVSNLFYGGEYYALDFDKINCGDNTYKNFLTGNLKYYEFPYPLGSDIYVSDSGIYLPSQCFTDLNKNFQGVSTYQALSRQVSENNFHINAQNLNRVWDKVREQSDTYIMCNKCIFIFGFVIQSVTIYDKAESCINRVKPCRIKVPMFNKQAKISAQCYLDDFYNKHGTVKMRLLFYKNKSKHDTLYFREMLKNGKKQ